MFTWNDTLFEYLDRSNEDQQVVQFIISSIIPLVKRMNSKIRWLEIGPGPGTKTWPIAKALVQNEKIGSYSIRLIEPDPIWQEFLCHNYPSLLSRGQFLKMRFEEYVRSESERRDHWQPNFITCFHVLYEHNLIEEFLLYLKRQEQRGCRLIACVIVESESSDFFRLRQKLQQFGQPQPLPAVLQIRSSISKLDLPASEVAVNSQYCRIPDNEESLKWLLAFLLGCEKETLKNLPEAVRMEATEMIQQFLAEKHKQVLEVPDVAFTFTIG